MAEIRDRNFSWKDLSSVVSDSDTVYSCNCVQLKAGTVVPAAKFTRCNCMNIDTSSPGATFEDCLVVQKDLCAWLHEGIGLPEETENCRHVVNSYEVDIDGAVYVEYIREDTVL